MPTFSKPSSPIFSISVPEPKNIKVDFVYNYYVYDESTNPISKLPESLKKKLEDKSEITNFLSRLPRYNQLSWECPPIVGYSSSKKRSISENIEKIISEDNLIGSKFSSYSFSSLENLEDAYKEINKKTAKNGISQSGIIDSYISDLLTSYSESEDKTDLKNIKSQVAIAVASLERIADRPESTLGLEFYGKENNKKKNNSGLDQIISQFPTAQIKLNSFVLPDIFVSSSISDEEIAVVNKNYNFLLKSSFEDFDLELPYIDVGNKIEDLENVVGVTSIIGYLIERHELTENGFIKNKVFIVENPLINSFVDYEVKYGTTYYYSIKTIAELEIPCYDSENFEIRNVTYYVASKPVFKNIDCNEDIPPPYPIDLNFVWDYKKKKLNVVWGMPVNPQRDIKQFQVFRRNSIDEPFELIRQKCFDYSTKKSTTQEVIDGNSQNMSKEEISFVDYDKFVSLSYVDDDFFVDAESLTCSKYIYTISSIDAHGMISNYGSQIEVTFDFFKNKLIKKLISNGGAPRQYPNMYVQIDTFKDVIKTSGPNSSQMKIYFMPEYFKISYNSGLVQEVVSTKQKNSFYTMQFINLQNQKSDSLKIVINDPENLASDFNLLESIKKINYIKKPT